MFEGHTSSAWCLLQLNDGQLASGSDDNTIRLWNTQYYKCNETLTKHSESIWVLIQLADRRLGFGSYDKTIII